MFGEKDKKKDAAADNYRKPAMRHWGSGRDVPDEMDCTPIAMPADARIPESLEAKVARFMRQHMETQEDANAPLESWDESNDFEEEDPDTLGLHSNYQFDDLVEVDWPPSYTVEDNPPAFSETNSENSARSLTDAENRAQDSPEPTEAGEKA